MDHPLHRSTNRPVEEAEVQHVQNQGERYSNNAMNHNRETPHLQWDRSRKRRKTPCHGSQCNDSRRPVGLDSKQSSSNLSSLCRQRRTMDGSIGTTMRTGSTCCRPIRLDGSQTNSSRNTHPSTTLSTKWSSRTNHFEYQQQQRGSSSIGNKY